MKAKFGAIVTDGRGKLSGHVFQQSRSGSIMKNKTSPLNKKTSVQLAQRALVSSISSSWSGLSAVNRVRWEQEAKLLKKSNVFGQQCNLSGFSLYTQCNLNLYSSDQVLLEAPVVPDLIPNFEIDRIERSISANYIVVVLKSGVIDGRRVVVYATPVLSNGVTNASRYAKKISTNVVNAGLFGLFSDYLAAYSYVPTSGKVWIEFSVVDNAGFASQRRGQFVTFIP